MTTAKDEVLAEFEAGLAPELIAMWRASFEDGVGIIDPHPLEEQRRYLFSTVVPSYSIRVAKIGDQLVGFVAANRESIGQLYVRVGFYRQGIGARLLDWAKAQSGGSLWLYTFARNSRARMFYESHGFIAVEHGFEPEWKLEDVKYKWSLEQNATSR